MSGIRRVEPVTLPLGFDSGENRIRDGTRGVRGPGWGFVRPSYPCRQRDRQTGRQRVRIGVAEG